MSSNSELLKSFKSLAAVLRVFSHEKDDRHTKSVREGVARLHSEGESNPQEKIEGAHAVLEFSRFTTGFFCVCVFNRPLTVATVHTVLVQPTDSDYSNCFIALIAVLLYDVGVRLEYSTCT
jgi:hypothetical protein